MKNRLIYILKSKVKISIKGRNIERFLRKLVAQKIELLNITYPNSKQANIIIYKKDYEKVEEIKSIYEIDILNTYGAIKIKKKIQIHQFFLLFLILGIIFLFFLSNIIFKVEIIHNDAELRTFLKKELENYDIKEKSFKKSFNQIEKIKEEIKNKYKDKIEWLEIENVGTKYIVRVEERQIPDTEQISKNQNIIAKKDAIIKRVDAISGEVVRDTNDYVKKGDVIISGNIYLNEEVKSTTSATGTVYGEVWYQTTVEFPFTYYEEKDTGNTQNVLVLKFLNKEWNLTFNPYKKKRSEETVLLKHNFLPISLTFQKQKEIQIIDNVYTEEQAIQEAEKLAIQKMEEKLKDTEHIISQKNLKINIKESKIVLDIFFTVYEDITDYQEIVEEIPEPKEE